MCERKEADSSRLFRPYNIASLRTDDKRIRFVLGVTHRLEHILKLVEVRTELATDDLGSLYFFSLAERPFIAYKYR
jgi:hypothetical protein